jgi:hypothetical protein
MDLLDLFLFSYGVGNVIDSWVILSMMCCKIDGESQKRQSTKIPRNFFSNSDLALR